MQKNVEIEFDHPPPQKTSIEDLAEDVRLLRRQLEDLKSANEAQHRAILSLTRDVTGIRAASQFEENALWRGLTHEFGITR